jgi:hypothetical protein
MPIHNRLEFFPSLFGVEERRVAEAVNPSGNRSQESHLETHTKTNMENSQTTLGSCSSGEHTNTGSVKDEPTVRN